LGAFHVYLIFSGATSLFFALIFTVMGVYRVTVAGLNPLQLVLVGTALEVTYFLFNVPTGVVADTYSRKLSVVIGMLLFGAGFLLEGFVPVFAAIVAAQVIEGLGYTFMEGALEAWIADEVGEENVGRAFLRGAQAGQVGGFVGIFASVALASIGLAWPIVLGGALFLALAAWLALAMPETGFQRPKRAEPAGRGVSARVRESLGDMTATVRDGARVMRYRPLAFTILAVAAVFGGFSEGFDRFWEAHFLTSIGLPDLGGLDPVVWFGIIGAGSSVLGFVATGVATRRLSVLGPRGAVRALFAFDAVLIGSVLLFALAGNFALALAAYWSASLMRILQGPVYTAWLNQDVDSRVRATVLSMSGQADALGQFTVGPALGALGTTLGLRAALAAAAAALSPALLLYGRALRRGPATTTAAEHRPVATEA
jgi:DHA3 family tetracycline resistance protein-like MFS transporter